MSKIEAKIIAHSRSKITGKEIVTWELTYPRFIHSEFMTHRLFSRNAASSRAIPVAKIIEMVRQEPAMPVHWGENQPGMQAKKTLSNVLETSAKFLWIQAANSAAFIAEQMTRLNLHKQVVNRILEPFQWMKTVMTATEHDNWFWLRDHEDAQPEIQALAHLMWEELQKSSPVTLDSNDWHMPYFGGENAGYWLEGCGIPLEDALAISASCCAQVSYRKLDDSLEKAKDIFAKLIESKPCHASPTEHQATPMVVSMEVRGAVASWQEGVTHMDKDYNLWSGNFKGFIQHRQLIPENTCWEYTPKEAKE